MGKEWSKEDLARLEELRGTDLPWTKVAEHFPGRSSDAIRLKSNAVFGPREKKHIIRGWTPLELAILHKYLGSETREEIGNRLGRSASSVQTKVRQLGLTKKVYRRWSDTEVRDLLYWWGEEPPEKTAKRVGRTVYGCQQKLYKLLGRTGHLGGWVTVNQLTVEHGHSSVTYLKAATELDIRPRKYVTGGGRVWRLFSDEQADRILEHLNRPAKYKTQTGASFHRWARDHDRCRHCGTDGTKYQERHGGNGLCVSCHQSWRRGTIEVEGLHAFATVRKRWSARFDCCRACGSTARAHGGKGLCDVCRRKIKQNRLEPMFDLLMGGA